MIIRRLVVVLVVSVFSFSCGDTNNNYNKNDDVKKNIDSCIGTGNSANFNVTCTKDIKSFQYKGITFDLAISGVLVAEKIILKITKLSDKIFEGNANPAVKLDLKINHTDESISNISILE